MKFFGRLSDPLAASIGHNDRIFNTNSTNLRSVEAGLDSDDQRPRVALPAYPEPVPPINPIKVGGEVKGSPEP